MSAIETVAIGSLLLLAGYWLRTRIRILDRFNLPAPVIGGLAAAVLVLAAKMAGLAPIKFDSTLQQPLMIAFFTSLGFAASLRLLRRGGPQVILLLAIASVLAVVQGLLGAAVAVSFGRPALLGVLTGTVTLSGGPATGLAFAPQFESAGVSGAAAVATATAMAGILLASVFGSPLATFLITRHKLDPRLAPAAVTPRRVIEAPPGESPQDVDHIFTALKVVAVILVSMWVGGLISTAIRTTGVTLPAYIGAMLVAGALRNLDDATGWLDLPYAAIEVAGAAALSLFLVLAMMTLDLSLLVGLAAPLIVNLLAQAILMAIVVLWPVWWLMGRDYDAAVAAGGFTGFMLGTTANAMAIMGSLTEKYAYAPRAFLTVPLVGGFFIDFVNALIITGFLNVLR